jgi:uncharacterized protein (DUF2235 family)
LPRDGGLRPKNEGTKMPRNIIIFSDGTGQVGGLRPDERRSNIYKLYRATRCGPDTDIDPATQVTFYDAGLGSMPPEGTFFVVRAYRWLHNLFSLATGLGITTNIIDCYCAILSMWEPGDRVFVFGFSRGAYTVRCLAAVLSMCGVPTTMADGKTPLRRDAKSIKKIANEAVKNVYQHVSSPADEKYVGQRKAIALRFRRKYNSDVGDIPNVNPYFIGVFDTVASLGSYRLSAAMVAGAAALLLLGSWALSMFALAFWTWMLVLGGLAVAVAGIWYVVSHLRYATGVEGYTFLETLHFTSPKMKFYDPHLDNEVRYARHALSLDENRNDFAIVKWGSKSNKGPPRKDSDPDWLQQVWFAGNHSDVGGSYLENESRLSDISLKWMVHAAMMLPDENGPDGAGIKVNPLLLQLRPDPLGPQHDEREPGFWGVRWPKGLRRVDPEAILHSSVYARSAAVRVPHFYSTEEYSPENLADHIKFQKARTDRAAPPAQVAAGQSSEGDAR